MGVERVAYKHGNARTFIAVDNAPGRGTRPDLWPSVGEYPCYDAFLYSSMTHDAARNRAFRLALARAVPGRRVLDIGTGQDLNWALEAARLGARRVTAIEAIPQSYARAVEALAGRPEAPTIDLLRGVSFDVELDQRAEVCVAELIGSIASAEGMLAVMADARRRLLTPDAIVVPRACETLAGAVSLRAMFPDGIGFTLDAMPYLTEIFDLYGGPFDVRLCLANVGPDCVLSTATPVERLFFDGSAPLDEASQSRLEIHRDGTVDGLLLWIRLVAGRGVPAIDALRQRTSWIPVYLPLFETPVPVSSGDVLDIEFHRRTGDDGLHPDYAVEAVLTTSSASTSGSFTSRHHAAMAGSAAVYRDLFASDLSSPG
jgi:protein arginine N-methyltransferase 1